MKKQSIFYVAVAFLLSLARLSSAQIADIDNSNSMANQIVELTNQGNAAGVAELASEDFLKTISKDRLIGLVNKMHSLGQISRPELILDLNEQRRYKALVKQTGKPDRLLLLVLGVESQNKYFSIGIAPYTEPVPREKPLSSDNLHKTALDNSIQASVDRYVEGHKAIGISIAIFGDKKTSFFNYGETREGSGGLPTKRSIYEIGSITKTMTGMLLAQAVTDKKLSLDNDVREFLPGKFPNLEFNGKPIRLKHLSTHTSGLPPSPPGIPDYGTAIHNEKYNHDKLLSDLATVKLTQEPGSEFSYSNMGGGLCGLVLEKAYGERYETLLRKRIFGPAGMRKSGISLTRTMNQNYATPYDSAGKQTDRWIVNGIESAGAVRSDAEDMLKYARYNLEAKNPAVALSHRPIFSSAFPEGAIFWRIANSRTAGSYYNHEGGTGGFSTSILLFPDKKMAVVAMMNVGEQEPRQLAYEIALRILNSKPK